MSTDVDDVFDKLMGAMSDSDSNSSDNDSGSEGALSPQSSRASHSSSIEKDFMSKLASQKSLSFEESKDADDNDDDDDSLGSAAVYMGGASGGEKGSGDGKMRMLPTTTPSTSPNFLNCEDVSEDDSTIFDSEDDQREAFKDERMGASRERSKVAEDEGYGGDMIVIKANDDDASSSSGEEENEEEEEEGSYQDSSDSSEFDYDFAVSSGPATPSSAARLANKSQPKEHVGRRNEEKASIYNEQKLAFSANSSAAPAPATFSHIGYAGNVSYIGKKGGAAAAKSAYDTQVKSFGFRGATSADIDRTTEDRFANDAQSIYRSGANDPLHTKSRKAEEPSAIKGNGERRK